MERPLFSFVFVNRVIYSGIFHHGGGVYNPGQYFFYPLNIKIKMCAPILFKVKIPESKGKRKRSWRQ